MTDEEVALRLPPDDDVVLPVAVVWLVAESLSVSEPLSVANVDVTVVLESVAVVEVTVTSAVEDEALQELLDSDETVVEVTEEPDTVEAREPDIEEPADDVPTADEESLLESNEPEDAELPLEVKTADSDEAVDVTANTASAACGARLTV